MKIIVTGKNGQLGSELQQLAAQFAQHEFVFIDREELDITNEAAVKDFMHLHKPDGCIHCAAYTAVDKAETEQEIAKNVNANAVKYLAEACEKYKARLIQISTDYVFNGNGTEPYLPNAATEPVNYYGYTKWLGEQNALQYNSATVIIRTSWVYSEFGANFVKTMLRLMKEKPALNVVNDQVGCPTYAKDLAAACLKIIFAENFTTGIHHYSNTGIISWYNFAVAINEIAALTSCKVAGITSINYPTPAKRPSYSAMDLSSIENDYQVYLRPWREALEECMQKLLG